MARITLLGVWAGWLGRGGRGRGGACLHPDQIVGGKVNVRKGKSVLLLYKCLCHLKPSHTSYPFFVIRFKLSPKKRFEILSPP